MRIVFCGSGPMAIPSLLAIHAGRHELACVVTQPARRAGRGGKLRPTQVARTALDAGLDVRECVDINADSVVAALGELRPDVICVVDFGQMIRQPVRETARLSTFNLHGSVLPELRGAAPVQWAIIRGCERTGVTTFELVDKLDAGPIYLQARTPIRLDESAEQLRRRLSRLGAELVCETIELLATGEAHAREQDDSLATLAPRLKKSDGYIDFLADAVSIRNLIHGTWPWPGAKAVLLREGGRQDSSRPRDRKPPLLPVTIAAAAVIDRAGAGSPGMLDETLTVATGDGGLRILRIKPAGKSLMDWCDFLNGYRVQTGDRFISVQI